MCRSSRAIMFRFNSKTQWQMFLLLYGRHVCVPQRAQIWRLHTRLYKFGWHTSANNARMKNTETWFLARFFINKSSIVSRILDFIHWLVTIISFHQMTGEDWSSLRQTERRAWKSCNITRPVKSFSSDGHASWCTESSVILENCKTIVGPPKELPGNCTC